MREFFLCHSRELPLGSGSSLRCGLGWIALVCSSDLLDVGGFETMHQEPCLNLRKPNLYVLYASYLYMLLLVICWLSWCCEECVVEL